MESIFFLTRIAESKLAISIIGLLGNSFFGMEIKNG
jgi:hypothetical protein